MTEADRPAAELADDRLEQRAVDALEAVLVDLQQLERLVRDLRRDHALVPHLGDVPDAAQDPVRDSRRAAGAPGDLAGRLVRDLDREDPRRAADDARELLRSVVIESEGHAEAVAERRRQQARACGRADEREGRQVERERAGRRALAHDDVDAKVLEGRVEHLLGGAGKPVDLVDEEDVALLQRGQDRGHVLPLDGRARDGANADAELLADHIGEAGLAEAGRAGEQDVIERLAAGASRRQRDRELLLDPLLTDEVVEPLRPERAVELLLVDLQVGGEELGHAAFRRATRTRSSAGSSGSTSARARSASTSE